MSIVPLQYFRIDGTYIVDLETGENASTLLPQWVYQFEAERTGFKSEGDGW
jgi:hypothetical protein